MIPAVRSTVRPAYSSSCPSWAENRNGILIQSFRGELTKAQMEQREKDIADTAAFMEEYRRTGGKFEITREQLKTLTESFDPNDMTYREYMTFIDHLCEYGILDEGDKDYVSYNALGKDSDLVLIPLKYDIPICTWGRTRSTKYTNSFSSSGGNILDWAGYMADAETYNTQTRSYEKTRTAVLYGKIQDVLLKMKYGG